jgi:hypothetical protein
MHQAGAPHDCGGKGERDRRTRICLVECAAGRRGRERWVKPRLLERCSSADEAMLACRRSRNDLSAHRLSGYCSAIVFAIVFAIVISGVSLFLACCLQWLLFFIVIYNASPQKCPAVDLKILSGDEARAGTAEETHRRRDILRRAAPSHQRVNEGVMRRLRLP